MCKTWHVWQAYGTSQAKQREGKKAKIKELYQISELNILWNFGGKRDKFVMCFGKIT